MKRRPKKNPLVPNYRGKSWCMVRLPNKTQDWAFGGGKSIAKDGDGRDRLHLTLKHLNKERAWRWPKRRHFFFSDLHADPQAFAESLVASGGVQKNGPLPIDFTLTDRGRDAVFVIGGDCFDKGISNLGLLRVIKHLIDQGARVRILAGNHDIRLLLGITTVGVKSEPHNDHFFIRTGQKIIPLLREIWDDYLKDGSRLTGMPSLKTCKRRLYPSPKWPKTFPQQAAETLKGHQIKREIARIEKKILKFEDHVTAHGMTLREVYASVEMWKRLFISPGGEFSWFFDRVRLAYQSGSFLFVHAGLDDSIAENLRHRGIKDLNRAFRDALATRPLEFYYGPLCNMIRTKYRPVDLPFSKKGARHVKRAGFTAIIHGHRNLHFGQRLAGRQGFLHVECDASLDSQTRAKERVRGRGAAVTIIEPKGCILGISSDYPVIKIFDPEKTAQTLISAHKIKRHT